MPPAIRRRFCANLSFLFTEVDFLDRFAAAAAAGFTGVEYLFPYDYPAAEIVRRLQAAALEQVLFNLPPGDWAAGERGIACLPGREAEFGEGVGLALAYAAALGCRRLHAMAGIRPAGVADDALRTTFIANLRDAARLAAPAGVTLLIEPINSRIDMPGYWLDTPTKALALLDAIGEPNVMLQFDAYHARVMGGDPLPQLAACLSSGASPKGTSFGARLGHVQIADYPGRHEPGSGDIDFAALFGALDDAGYDGWIGCEYRPCAATRDGLGWLRHS